MISFILCFDQLLLYSGHGTGIRSIGFTIIIFNVSTKNPTQEYYTKKKTVINFLSNY